MKRDRSEKRSGTPQGTSETTDEAALMEEIRQLRAAIKIYRELVERLLRERDGKE